MEEIKTESAPDWAMFLAQDGDGVWYWHANKPKPNGATVCGEGYWISTGESCIACRGELIGDWRDTLEKRPEEFKPFVSVEDNQEREMNQDNEWFERGELPPVGVECEIRHSCWNSEKYERVTVAAITNEYLIVKYVTLEQHYMLKDISFRPIRTERDELVNVFINHYGNPKGAEGYIGIADAILAAGFSLGAK